jgi:hypothetical protein
MAIFRGAPVGLSVLFVLFSSLISAAIPGDSAPEGRWEGEIEFPRRPIVFSVDLDKKQGRLSTTGATAFPLTDLKSDGTAIRFEMRLKDEVVSLRATGVADELRGTAAFADMRGKPLAQGSFLLRRVPDLPAPRSREEAWRQDLDAMLSRFLPYDRSFDDAARTKFRRRIRELGDSVARRSDSELMVELARAVALGRNAHTRLYLVRNRTEVRRLPIRVWWFRDGLYVVRATEEYKDLLGCRVEKIGGMTVAAAAKQVDGIKAGNASWQRYMGAYLLTSPEILVGCHIIADAERVPFEVRRAGSELRRDIIPLPLRKNSAPLESWWDLSPFSKGSGDTPLCALDPERAPLYLRKPDVHYWFEYLPQHRILYFQYNRSQELPTGPSLSDFGRELLAVAGRSDVEALVVDLRFNTGGNLYLATPLMKGLREELAKKKVFVITGRATFSAGISHAAQWKEWGAKIVGEHPGDELDLWGEGGNLELPNSRLTVHYSNGFHSYSKREYPERQPYFFNLGVDTLAPDFPAEPTWADYAGGKDPAMDLIQREVAAGGPDR